MTRVLTEEDLILAAELATNALNTILVSGEVDPALGDPIDDEAAKAIALEFFGENREALVGQSIAFVRSFVAALLWPRQLEQFAMMIRSWEPAQLAELAEQDAAEAHQVVRDAYAAQDKLIASVKSTVSLLVRRALALGLMLATQKMEPPLALS